MKQQVFTFGCGQTFANGFVTIIAKSEDRCREIMFETFGERWSMQYNVEKRDELVAHGMTPLCTITETDQARKTITEKQIYVC